MSLRLGYTEYSSNLKELKYISAKYCEHVRIMGDPSAVQPSLVFSTQV